jgi:hypothetical protein
VSSSVCVENLVACVAVIPVYRKTVPPEILTGENGGYAAVGRITSFKCSEVHGLE